MNILSMIKNLSSGFKTNAILILLTLLIVWFILPLIPISGNYPFESVGARLLLLAVFAGAWGIISIANIFKTQQSQAVPFFINKFKVAIAAIKQVWQHIKLYVQFKSNNIKQKVSQDHRRRQLFHLPWYVVLGTQQSGKKQCLSNFGLYFSRPEHFGEDATSYIEQFPDFDWWFSEQAVLIDTMTHDKDVDTGTWKQFIRLLRRERKNKPLNGIILTISLTDLMLYSNQQRQDFVQDTCRYIREIHSTFKSMVPVYIIFTKCDLVEGFLEFFNDLSKEELRQVWGMTMPLSNCHNVAEVQHFFRQEYATLINQLRKRNMWALDVEKSQRGRELINAFPQQMQLLKKPIENFISELFGATRYPKALQLRGIYFTSCTQEEGIPQDFLLQAMSKKFQLVPPQFQRPQRMSECYFTRNLFFEIILSEAKYLGESERSKHLKKISLQTAYAAAPLLVILASIGMYKGYQENAQKISGVEQHIQQYHANLRDIKPDNDSLTHLLPALNELQKVYQLYHNHSGWGSKMLFATRSIRNKIKEMQYRALKNIYIPRVASQLESNLNQNIQDLNLLYATLKAYLVFSDTYHVPNNAVEAPMQYQWNQTFREQPDVNQSLAYFLSTALEQPADSLPLDLKLVERIKRQLEEVIPANRAYGLMELRADVSQLPPVLLRTLAGDSFDQVFTSNSPLRIPALYTKAGFETIFLPNYADIAHEVAQDNRDIGLVTAEAKTQTASQIDGYIRNQYHEKYLQHWGKELGNIDIAPFNNLQHAIDVLSILIGEQSPLPRVLNSIYDNSYNMSHSNVKISQEYAQINKFSQGSGKPTWSNIVTVLTEMRDYLLELQASTNPNLSAFETAKSAIQDSKNPIQSLASAAENAPEPVKHWLNTIANNYWNIILQGTHTYLNTAWQEVMLDFNNNIQGRYPLNPNATVQIPINNFNYFFGNEGILAKYFDKYLDAFIDTSTTPWSLYNVNNLHLNLDTSSISLFAKAYQIKTSYFPLGSGDAHLNLTIKPLILDPKASSVQLILGNERIIYSHGPQLETVTNWPMPFNAEQANITITQQNSSQQGSSASGPWALFKLLKAGELRETNEKSQYRFNVNVGGSTASFLLSGPANIALLQLNLLEGFNLPEKVAFNNSEEKQS